MSLFGTWHRSENETDLEKRVTEIEDFINTLPLIFPMASNKGTQGEAFSSPAYSGGYEAFHAFDGNNNTSYAYAGTGGCYIGYKFNNAVSVGKFEILQRLEMNGQEGLNDLTLYYSDDGETWKKSSDTFTLERNSNFQSFNGYSSGKHCYWKVEATSGYGLNRRINLFTIL